MGVRMEHGTPDSVEEVVEVEKQSLINVYRRQPVVLEYGRGARVVDINGKEYIDLVAGIAVNSIGHAHPAVTEAVCNQVKKLIHTSNLYYTMPQINLAIKLKELTGMDRFFFCNSGTEAVEGALKFARRVTGKKNFIAFSGSFHGRSMGALSVTFPDKYRNPFLPLLEGVEFVEFNNPDDIISKISRDTAGIVVELVQGEGGVNVAEKDFVRALIDVRDDYDCLLIVDEVQTGFGRTGRWFAKDHFDLKPDIITMAKAMGGGIPIGGIGVTEEVAAAISPGDHASTFGGNPLACSASLATIKVMEKEKLVEKAKADGEYFMKSLKKLPVDEIRGLGMMIGIDVNNASEVVNEALKKGLLVNNTSSNTLRLVPPLVITREEIDKAVEILGGIITGQ